MQIPKDWIALLGLWQENKSIAAVVAACSKAAPYPGFIAVAMLALGIVERGLGVHAGGWLSTIAMLIAAIATLLGDRRPRVLVSMGLGAAGLLITALATTGRLGASASVTPLVVAAALIIVQFAMLSTFRLSPVLYILYAMLVGQIVWLGLANGVAVLIAVLFIGATLASTNYTIQFVLDHKDDYRRLWEKLDQRVLKKVVVRTILLWLPVLVFAYGGLKVNALVQDEFKQRAYLEWQLFRVAKPPEVTELNYQERDIRKDALDSIEASEVESKAKVQSVAQGVFSKGNVSLDNAAQKTREVVRELRPPPFSTARCEKQDLKRGNWLFRFVIPLTPICKLIINTTSRGVQTSYDRAERRIAIIVDRRVKEAKGGAGTAERIIIEEAKQFVGMSADGARTTVRSLFGIWLVVQMAGAVMLLGGLVGGIVMVLGRVLFDARAEETESVNTFALGKGAAGYLAFTNRDDVRLNDSTLAGSTRGWWVFPGAARKGEGTHLRPRFPQPTRCLLQRVFSNRYVLTRVDTDLEEVGKSDRVHSPTISLPGDHQFVCISLPPGQAVTFRMSDLIAFTDGVHLRSVYTTHVGANLLGLGSFYAVAFVGAEGSAMGLGRPGGQQHPPVGTLVLRSDGNRIESAAAGQQLSPRALLAWDRRTKFSVKQELSVLGVWIAPPHIQSHSADAVIYDEGAESGQGMLRNLWRMVRYLFVPF